MNRKLTLILTACSFLFLASCDHHKLCVNGSGLTQKRTLNISQFDALTMSISGKVYVSKGAETKVEVEGQGNVIDQLSTNVQNQHWEIEFKKNKCFNYGQLDIHITVPNIKEINITGSGDIVMLDSFDNNSFSARISGSGDMELKTNTLTLYAVINGSGDMEIEGTANTSDLLVTGSGDLHAFNFDNQTVEAKISGSGNILTSVDKELKALITGSGSVYYKGNPSISSRITGSGSVVQN